jgi:haloacid dehalogenase-like hydrolase
MRVTSTGINRRVLLSALSALPALPILLSSTAPRAQAPASQLASWNDGGAKQAILDFVRAATDSASAAFVPPEDRVATFDQDGTMWVEHPLYTQALFALDRVHELASQHLEWENEEPFKAALSNDLAAVAHFAEGEWAEIIFGTHAGMSEAAFSEIASQWIAKAKHPRFKRLYTELVYQPMLEVMDTLRANGFKTYIVTGGGQDFVRTYARRIYGVPQEQVVGSSIATKYEITDGRPELIRLPKLFFDCNFGGKAVGIGLFIGKRPCAAFGNSTGDQQMLEYAGGGGGAQLRMLVLHDDAQREYAYGPAQGLPESKVGTFTQALYDQAKKDGWTVISMKTDWKRVFAFD